MTTASLAHSDNLAMIQYAKGELEPDELRQFMMLYPGRQKQAGTGIAFALLLGMFGGHKFWLGQNGAGVGYLLCGTIGWALVVPPIILSIIVIVDACQMGSTVKTYNTSQGRQLVQEMQLLRS
jgi:TM2 domain-containing membrane protein YozV